MNKQWRLKKRPEAGPSEDCFELVEADIPELEPGKALIKTWYLGVAPVMLRYMQNETDFESALALGDLMIGRGVGQVIASDASHAAMSVAPPHAVPTVSSSSCVGAPMSLTLRSARKSTGASSARCGSKLSAAHTVARSPGWVPTVAGALVSEGGVSPPHPRKTMSRKMRGIPRYRTSFRGEQASTEPVPGAADYGEQARRDRRPAMVDPSFHDGRGRPLPRATRCDGMPWYFCL